MATKCLSLVKGRRIRVTKLDGCGRPVYGENSQAVSSGFISVALTANTTESDEINVTNAAGEVCVFEPSTTSLTGYGVEIQFCEVDPDLFALITGQDPYGTADNIVGFTVNTKLKASDSGFALELWAGSASGDACSDAGAQGNYGYMLLPFLQGGIIGDFTVENAAVTFTITGANTRDGNGWGVGPYEDVFVQGAALTALPQALDPNDALLTILTTAAPPEAACGTRPLLDPTITPVTAVTATVAGMTASFAPDPADLVAPFYYEFGDGTWDYTEPSVMGAIQHTYAKPGTYTVKVSTNGEWVTTPVTITAAAPQPTITTIAPATGAEAGGTAVVITGTGFTGATGVVFGLAQGQSVVVVNDTTINVNSPAGTGTVDVQVVAPGGSAIKTGGFVYA